MTLRALALGMGAAECSSRPAAMAADLGGGPPRGSLKDAPPPPLPLYSWSGLYIGVHAGYGWTDLDWTAGGTTVNDSGAGWLGGGQVGYNWQRGALVFGVEADISSSGMDGSTTCPNSALRAATTSTGWPPCAAVSASPATAAARCSTAPRAAPGPTSTTAPPAAGLLRYAIRLGGGRRHRAHAHPQRDRAHRIPLLRVRQRHRAGRHAGRGPGRPRSEHADRALRPQLQVLSPRSVAISRARRGRAISSSWPVGGGAQPAGWRAGCAPRCRTAATGPKPAGTAARSAPAAAPSCSSRRDAACPAR